MALAESPPPSGCCIDPHAFDPGPAAPKLPGRVISLFAVCEPVVSEEASFIRVDPRVLQGCRRGPERLGRVVGGRLRPDRRVDLGQTWDGVHYLLSARRRAGAVRDRGDPFGLALFGGDQLNPYVLDKRQVVCWLAPEAVVRVDRALQKVGGGQLRRNYDPEAMERMAVAPGRWRQRGEEGFEQLLDAFLQWRELYHRAAEEGQAVICVLT